MAESGTEAIAYRGALEVKQIKFSWRFAMSRKACVVGSRPNGLAAAIVLAQAGLQVDVFEAQPTAGGAARTMELTLPGFLHDFGSAVHPMGAGSPSRRQSRAGRRVYGFALSMPPLASSAIVLPAASRPSVRLWRGLP